MAGSHVGEIDATLLTLKGQIDNVIPTSTDWLGGGICVLGVAVIMFGARADG